ncbi:MAG: hypothetical protein JWN79_1810, partial [Gemmatimonadetes bacterium]|nr:hypothetical protein [Gemmatimonadota bacterium]
RIAMPARCTSGIAPASRHTARMYRYRAVATWYVP